MLIISLIFSDLYTTFFYSKKLLYLIFKRNKLLRANEFFMTGPDDGPSDLSDDGPSDLPDKDPYDNTKDDKYPPNVGNSSRKFKDNERLLKVRLQDFKDKGKQLKKTNFDKAEQAEKELELSEDQNLSQEERKEHKKCAEFLKAEALEAKEEVQKNNMLCESIKRQLDRNPNNKRESESDIDSDSDVD